MKIAALISGSFLHYLDHLASFCQWLHIPLIVNDPKIANKARKYYPHLFLIYCEYEHTFPLLCKYDFIVQCHNLSWFENEFFFDLYKTQKKIHLGWLGHGFSDKVEVSSCFKGLQEEKFLLLYGPYVQQHVQKQNISLPFCYTGHFRYHHYQKNKKLYDQIFFQTRPSIDTNRPSLLYAPTWKDYDRLTSLHDNIFPCLLALSKYYNVMIKLHPNTFTKNVCIKIKLQEFQQNNKNIILLDNIPLIFPILDFCSALLCDFSSIGYDFLAFDKPLFFLNPHKQITSLMQCGHVITEKEIMIAPQLLQKKDPFAKARKHLYAKTFGKKQLSASFIKNRISNFLKSQKNIFS